MTGCLANKMSLRYISCFTRHLSCVVAEQISNFRYLLETKIEAKTNHSCNFLKQDFNVILVGMHCFEAGQPFSIYDTGDRVEAYFYGA